MVKIMKYQGLREIFQITEYKDNCVYRTKSIGYAWVTFDLVPPKDTIYNSISTRVMKQLNFNMNRTVKDDAPDVEMVSL